MRKCTFLFFQLLIISQIVSGQNIQVARPDEDKKAAGFEKLEIRDFKLFSKDDSSCSELKVAADVFGSVVGSFNNVIAYSNGDGSASGTYNFSTGINTGMKWQCVEYVNRFYYVVYKVDLRSTGIYGDANHYFANAASAGLTAYQNGSAISPQVGDILCSNGGSYGHVAIIREVGSNFVNVIHQNWSNSTLDNSKTLTLTITSGKYSVGNFSASYPVAGWLRKNIVAIDAVLVKSSAPEIYLLKNNILHQLTDWTIYEKLRDNGYGGYLTKTDAEIASYFRGSKIISDGLICKENSNAVIYLIQYDKKRSFTDETIYTNRGYKLSGGDPISPTVITLPEGMLSGYASETPITNSGVSVSCELYFKKNGLKVSSFKVGDIIQSCSKLTAGDGYTSYNYVTITLPNGNKKYAYYYDGNVAGNYSFSDTKVPLRINNGSGITFNIVPNNWNQEWIFNSFQVVEGTATGNYTVDFWYEDINKPGTKLFTTSASYTIVDDQPTPTLTISTSNVNIESGAGSNGVFNINSNINWIVSYNAAWLSISTTSGSNNASLTVTATSANVSTNSRNATISISGGGITRTVVVTQAGASTTLLHFQTVLPTGSSGLIIIQNANINNSVLQIGDEIAVYDGTLCVGAVAYSGSYPLNLTAWLQETLPNGSVLPGANTSHKMIFKIWQKSTAREWDANPTIISGNSTFANALTVINPLIGISNITQRIVIKPYKFNLISLNVQEPDLSAPQIFEDLENLLIAEDDNGHYYVPSYSINTIGSVNVAKGYRVYLSGSSEDVLVLTGVALQQTNVTFNLTTGKFHMLGYPYQTSNAVNAVFSSIANSILIIKDDEGLYYVPDYSINTIGDLKPGKGYQIYTKSNIEFTYPANPSTLKSGPSLTSREAVNFQFIKTGISFPVIITNGSGLFAGDEIGIFCNETCVGGAVCTGYWPIIIAAWQADGDKELQGYRPGEIISFKIYSHENGKEMPACCNFKNFGDEVFAQNVFSVAELSVAEGPLPTNFYLAANYPNPFNSSTSIQYYLPFKCRISLKIFSIQGKLIKVLWDNEQEVGYAKSYWDGTDVNDNIVPSGVYICSFSNPTGNQIIKITLVK